MKKFMKLSLSACLLLLAVSGAFSQSFNLNEPVAVDPALMIGKLNNGLTYYIQNNKKPEKRVELRLVINAGSVCETENQQGLAHFVEHMCFNGSENFKGNEMVSMLESLGIQFGADLNAYTGFDETVYMLTIPTDNPDLLNKAFQVIEDWAHLVSFEEKEIDKERGVITEEWRLGLGAEDRMMQKYLPIIAKNSRYAERLPIGKIEIIKTFPYDTLRNFYKTWYRPNLMAVIVVGDIDPAFAEKKIKEHFDKITNPVNAPKRELYYVPDNDEPLVAIVTDKEASSQSISVSYKHLKDPEKTNGDFKLMLMKSLYTIMVRDRIGELLKKPETPFLSASIGLSGFIGRFQNVYSIDAVSKDNKLLLSLEAALIENQRILQHGFTVPELDRAKVTILTYYESMAVDVENQESEGLVTQYINNFLDGEPIPGIVIENEMAKFLLNNVSLDDMNQLAKKWNINHNMLIQVIMPEKKGVTVPTEKEIMEVINKVKAINTEAYIDNFSDSPLLPNLPKKGKVISRTENKEFNFTDVVFENGVKARLKPTTFQNDEILVSAFSFGGTSLYPDSVILDAMYATSIITSSGIGGFDDLSLSKKLTGKNVSISPGISETEEGIGGSSSPKDLETWLQLNYLYFTAPRKDQNEFETFKTSYIEGLKSVRGLPETLFNDSLNKIVTSHSPREISLPTDKQILQLKQDRMLDIYKDRFADASDFTYVFVGNFKTDEILPLLETYLGGLPSINRKETFKDLTPAFPAGKRVFNYPKNSEKQSNIVIITKGQCNYGFEERMKFYLLTEVLSLKLHESMREEQGGVYGVSANGALQKYPREEYSFSISFGCNPENSEALVKAVFDEMNKLKNNLPDEATLNKVKEQMVRQRELAEKDNDYWILILENSLKHNESIHSKEAYTTFIKSVTPEDIRQAAVKYLNTDNYIKAEFMPEKE